MDTLIKLRSNMDLLNNEEFLEFVKQLPTQYLANALFQSFKNELFQTTNIQDVQQNIIPSINQMIDTINTIIHSREANEECDHDEAIDILDSNNENEQKVLTSELDNLPLVLISKISSFLKLKEIIKFEKTNRNIFIGARSTISIKKMNVFEFSKCIEYSNQYACMHNFFRFEAIQELEINVEDLIDEYFDYDDETDRYESEAPQFIEANLSNLPIWRHLNTLHLKEDDSMLYRYDIHGDIDAMHFIPRLDQRKLSNITTFRWSGARFYESYEFTKNIFPNLEFLELYFDEHALIIFDNNMFNLSSLRGLSITPWFGQYGESEDQPIIGKMCTNLESFHSSDASLSKINKFAKLKELCVTFLDDFGDKKIYDFGDFLNNLQRINLNVSYISNKDNYQHVMKCLLSGHSLNYISISCEDKELSLIFKLVQKVLIDKQKRQIKVRICCEEMTDNDIDIHIINLSNCLSQISNHFMLICDFKSKEKNEFILSKVNRLNTACFIDYGGSKIIVSNKGCKINGYHQKWIMDCCECAHV